MNDSQLVSVIVPIYNVEKVLVKCIDSILEQTYNNIEIILIDDGSTDSSSQICNDYALRDERIKVIHKNNGGLSDARNAGIKAAVGDYYLFVDSDDYIEKKTVEILLKEALSFNVDICIFDINIISKDGSSHISSFDLPKGKTIKKISENVQSYATVCSSVWRCFYKANLIKKHNLTFEFQTVSEDVLFNMKAFAKAERVVYVKETLYNYLINPAGIVRGYKKDYLDRQIKFRTKQMEYINDLGLEKHKSIFADKFSGHIVYTIKNYAKISEEPFADKANCLRKIINNPVIRESVFTPNYKSAINTRKILWIIMKLKSPIIMYYVFNTLFLRGYFE